MRFSKLVMMPGHVRQEQDNPHYKDALFFPKKGINIAKKINIALHNSDFKEWITGDRYISPGKGRKPVYHYLYTIKDVLEAIP